MQVGPAYAKPNLLEKDYYIALSTSYTTISLPLRFGTNLAIPSSKSRPPQALEHHMKRRDFLKSVTGVAAGALVPGPAIFSSAKADARSETLLIVSESGPNN